jgi:hypothetical protein
MTEQQGAFRPQPISTVAVHHADYLTHGCPVCLIGEKRGSVLISHLGCTLFSCASCGVAYLVCADSLETVPAGLPQYGEMVIPEHPAKAKETS